MVYWDEILFYEYLGTLTPNLEILSIYYNKNVFLNVLKQYQLHAQLT